jgi:hypothetical protein
MRMISLRVSSGGGGLVGSSSEAWARSMPDRDRAACSVHVAISRSVTARIRNDT